MRMAMELFSWVMIAIFVGFLGGILLLGLYSPRSGADVLDWRPTRSPEAESRERARRRRADARGLERAAPPPRRARAQRGEVADSIDADRRELDRRAREHRGGGLRWRAC